MYIKILDENLCELDQFYFDKNLNNKNLRRTSNIPVIEEGIKQLLNNLDYCVAIYAPIENSDDFYISFLNKSILNYFFVDSYDFEGTFLSEVFLSMDQNKLILKIMKEVYETNKPQKLFFDYYEKDIIIRRFSVKVIKTDGFVDILAKDTTDYSSLSIEQELLFNNNITPIIIIQDGHYVKCNKKYLGLFGYENSDDVIDKKVGSFGFVDDSVELIYKNIDTILNEKLDSYEMSLEFKKNEKIYYSFDVMGNYIVYEGKPAVMAIFNDITEQEFNKQEMEKKNKESLFFQRNLELIQLVSDTGISYQINGKFTRSSIFYELVERDPIDTDVNKNIIWDFVIDEDVNIVKEHYEKIEKSNTSTDFIMRIRTAKGNLRYIYCYLKARKIDKESNELISLYRDVTDQQVYLNELETALKESLRLQNNLEHIQRISKTAISYTNDEGTLNWASSAFDLLKVDPKDYEDYHGDLFEVVLEEDKHYWHDAYDKCSPNDPETSTILRVVNGENKVVYVKCYILCNYDKEGNEIGYINFFQDISEQIERENRLKNALDNSLMLKKNLERIQGISKTSMCYKNDQDDSNIVWFTDGFSILDMNINDYLGTMAGHIINEDKNIWLENHAKCTPENPEISFIQRGLSSTGELKYIQTFVAYDFDEEGNRLSHVSFFQDITEEVERENRLKESLNETLKLQNNLNRIQSASKTAIGYSEDLIHSKWTPEVFDILEIDPVKYRGATKNLVKQFVIEDDLKHRKDCIDLLSPENPDVTFNQRVKTGKGNIKCIKTVIHQDYDKDGKIIDRVSFNQDITSETEYQNQLETALKDKEILLTEVHHRVKNNLQIILSLINLNRNYESNQGTILINTENRIYAMALIHEKIYGSASLSDVNMKDYVESLVDSLFDMYLSNITFNSKIESIDLDMEQSVPLGLIINELVTNTIKYAFPNDKEGKLYIEFRKKGKNYTLIFKDNGVGLPDDFDLNNLNGLGLMVVQNLTLQLGGTMVVMDCEGTGFKIEFDEN